MSALVSLDVYDAGVRRAGSKWSDKKKGLNRCLKMLQRESDDVRAKLEPGNSEFGAEQREQLQQKQQQLNDSMTALQHDIDQLVSNRENDLQNQGHRQKRSALVGDANLAYRQGKKISQCKLSASSGLFFV